MAGIRVVTDSASDLPPAEIERHGIAVVPLDVRLGDLGPEETRGFSGEEFWDACSKVSTLPETSAPSPGAFRDAFAKAADEGASGVLCVTISSDLSATYQAALAGAEELADRIPIEVVDSRSATMGEGMLVLEAVRQAASAESAESDESAQSAGRVALAAAGTRAQIEKITTFGALDTLENLRRGGRIGSAQAFFGSLLSIKPVIEVRDGHVQPESKQRTRSRSLQYLVDKVKAAGEITNLCVLHAMAPDIDQYVKMMGEVYPTERTLVALIGPVIGTHTGRGAVGVVYQLA